MILSLRPSLSVEGEVSQEEIWLNLENDPLKSYSSSSCARSWSLRIKNYHVFSEARERLQRLRELGRLREQENLIKTAKEQLQRLEENLKAMKARDASLHLWRRLWRQQILELTRTVDRDYKFRRRRGAAGSNPSIEQENSCNKQRFIIEALARKPL